MKSTKHEFLSLIGENSTVLDLGCGEAGYWAAPLLKNPNLKLSLFEPDKDRLRRASERISGKNLSYFSDLREISSKFDLIFSFSVLEHVWDKDLFFKNISNLLEQDGEAIINYDDGHFRSHVYRNRSAFYRTKNQLKTKLGPLWKVLGDYSKFQSPVNPQEVIRLLDKHGLYITHQEYSLLEDFKKFGKGLNQSELDAIYEALKNFELVLNKTYNQKYLGIEAFGQHNDLWSVMMSRTLLIKQQKPPIET